MTGGGRPLRFLAIVLGAWTGARMWWLWPGMPPPSPVARDVMEQVRPRAIPPVPVVAAVPVAVGPVRVRAAPPRATAVPRRVDARVPPAPVLLPAFGDPVIGAIVVAPGQRPYGPAEALPSRAGRWSASGWAILRGGRQRAGVGTPQLGGSQAGLRLAYTLDDSGRFALAGRVAAALATRQQEAAIGIEWRPARLPVRLVAERRIAVANARGGVALGAVGGVSDMPAVAGFRLDGYAQAGAIARNGVEGYADGALHVARPVFRTAGGVALDVGIGAWGAVQRGARRLDVGPAATLALPVGASRVRVALEWRQRIVGDARPMSGPALSIGTDL